MIPAMRDELALVLADVLGVPVYAYPAGTVSPPSVTILPGSPYIDGQFLSGTAGAVGLDLHVVGQATAPRDLDELIWSLLAALGGRGIRVEQVGSPTYSEAANTLGARISITLKWKA